VAFGVDRGALLDGRSRSRRIVGHDKAPSTALSVAASIPPHEWRKLTASFALACTDVIGAILGVRGVHAAHGALAISAEPRSA
jgi:hypothetical protein